MRIIKFSNNIRKGVYLLTLFFFVMVSLFIIYFLNIYKINQEYYERNNVESDVKLRKFPYPYRAALSISSDIDNTGTLEEFSEIQKFINTTEMTSMGKGVGLNVGNSFFFYEPQTDAISYFKSGTEVAQTIKDHIKKGYIDFMHSYGKKSDFTREDAVRALNELNENSLMVDVWVDHTKTIDNFGDDVTLGLGDHTDSKAYHADLTIAYGIKFVWLGRVTMITGQSVPITLERFTSSYDSEHLLFSLINIGKEFSKNILAVFGNKKYAIHKKNELVKITTLDDGQRVYEFMRFDNYWRGVSTGASNKGLAYVISKNTLDRLKETEGYMIVYTHLGKNDSCLQYICRDTQIALRKLAEEFEAGNIFVTTTSKLLNYYINHRYLNWSYNIEDDEISIHIYSIKDPIFGTFLLNVHDLEGFTFYVPDKSNAKIYLNNKMIMNIRRNLPDYTKMESVTITTKGS